MTFRSSYHPARALHAAWVTFVQKPWIYLLGGLALAATDFSGGPNWQMSLGSPEGAEFWEAVLLSGMAFVAIFGALVLLVVQSFLYSGFAATVESGQRGRDVSIASIFTDPQKSFRRVFLTSLYQLLLFVAGLLPSLLALGLASFADHELRVPDDVAYSAMAIALVVLFPFQVWFWLGLLLMRPAAAYEGLSPKQAHRRSLELVRGNRLWLVFYEVVLIAVYLMGACFCGIGLFLTYPWTVMAGMDSYLSLVREDRPQWWVEGVIRERQAAADYDRSTGSGA